VTVKEIIDIALSQGDNVSESDAAYIDRRRRARNFLIETVNDVWWERDWPWRRTQSDLTILSGNGYVAVPPNFDSLGNYGAVYRLVGSTQQYPPLEEVPESTIMDQRSGNRRSSTPRIFSLFGQDPVTQQLLLQIPLNDADVAIRAFYQKRPPKLLDAGDPEPRTSSIGITRSGQTATATAAAPHSFEMFDRVVIAGAVEPEYNGTYEVTPLSETVFTYTIVGTPTTPATGTITAVADVATGNVALRQVPERFHVKVLLNGIKAKLRESKGDARWQALEGQYQKSKLADMKKQLGRFQAEVRQLPSFFGERRTSGTD